MAKTLLAGSGLTVLQAQLGEWDNLNHLLVCEKTGQACIVDPWSAKYWQDICTENGWKLGSVVLTHSHWDHSRGVSNLHEAGLRIWVHELESQRGWKGPDTDRWNHAEYTHIPFQMGELEFEIHCTPGHTPGHMSLMISSQGENGLVLGDVLHNTAQIENTDWVSRADIDPAQTRITRRDLMDRLEREGIPVAAVHLARPGFGKIVRENGRRFWQGI